MTYEIVFLLRTLANGEGTEGPKWGLRIMSVVDKGLLDLSFSNATIQSGILSRSSPAFAFSATILSQYIGKIVHHIVKKLTILSPYYDNIVNIL